LLAFNEIILEDDKILSDYNIFDYCDLVLDIRP